MPSFWIVAPATAVKGPAIHFGDGKITVNTNVETTEITRAKRGVNRSMDDRIQNITIAYDMELNLLSLAALNVAVFGKAGTSAGDNSRSTDTPVILNFDFDAGDDGIAADVNKWYPLRSATERYRDVNSVSLIGTQSAYGSSGSSISLVEDVDYELDKQLGLVKFKTAIADDVISGTTSITGITATSKGYMKSVTPFQRTKWSGIGDLQIYDEDGTLIWRHTQFAVDLIPGGNLEFTPGTATVARIKANVKAPLGKIWTKELN